MCVCACVYIYKAKVSSICEFLSLRSRFPNIFFFNYFTVRKLSGIKEEHRGEERRGEEGRERVAGMHSFLLHSEGVELTDPQACLPGLGWAG